VGSSITYGSGVDLDQALPQTLEKLFETSPSGSRCSDDFSQAGFGPEQEWAMARDELASAPPAVMFVEVWDPAKRYSVVGDFAFDSRGLELDALGVPMLRPVPDVVGDALFRWSHLYQYMSLALAPDRLRPEGARRAKDGGTRLILLVGARLDRPLAAWEPEGDVLEVSACAARMGIETISIAQLLADQRVEDVRHDPCCHLNARGHALLAERILPRIARPPLTDPR
jgi:hypothetical protein